MQINFDELFKDRILATPDKGEARRSQFNFDPNISEEALQTQLKYALIPQSYRKSIINSFSVQTLVKKQTLSTPSLKLKIQKHTPKATCPEKTERKNKQKDQFLPTQLKKQLQDWCQLKEKPTIDNNSRRIAQQIKHRVPRKKLIESTIDLNIRKKSKYQQAITKSFYERLESDLDRRKQKASFIEQSTGLIDIATGTRLFRPSLHTVLK